MSGMRFDLYGDGALRATVRVEFHPGPDAVAEAVALDAYGGDFAKGKAFIAQLTKRHCADIVRDRYRIDGPPDLWPEIHDDPEYDALVELAKRRVGALFPETRVGER